MSETDALLPVTTTTRQRKLSIVSRDNHSILRAHARGSWYYVAGSPAPLPLPQGPPVRLD